MAALRTSIWIPEHPQRVADRHPGSSCEDPGSVCDSRLAADRPRKGRREPVGLAQFLSAVLPHAPGATSDCQRLNALLLDDLKKLGSGASGMFSGRGGLPLLHR